MTQEQQENIRNINLFILQEKSEDWKYRTSQYLEVYDSYIAMIEDIRRNVTAPPDTEIIDKIHAQLRKQRNKFMSDWINEGLRIVEENEEFTRQFNTFKNEFSSFETKMITTFTIILSMLAFIFSTVGATDTSPANIADIACGYVFAISLFSSMVFILLNRESDIKSYFKSFFLIGVAFLSGVFFLIL